METRFKRRKLIIFAILAVVVAVACFLVLSNKDRLFKTKKVATSDEVVNANNLVFAGDYQKVIDSLAVASYANAEEEVKGRLALARSYYALKDFSHAIEQFEKTLSVETDLYAKSNVDNSLANSYRDSNDFENARKFYAEAVQNNSKNSQAWANYTYMEYDQNNKEKAREIIKSALEALPSDEILKSAAERINQ